MHVAIVYESLFGNTHQVAEAIAAGVRDADASAQVAVVPVGNAKADQVARADLLIVGGPTHLRRMTSGTSRRKGLAARKKSAVDTGTGFRPEPGAGGPGVRDWFDVLPDAVGGAEGAAFDTRAEKKLAGGAARGIARRLRRHGYAMAAKPEGFVIEGIEGPLREGERDRARAWGAALAGGPRQFS